MPICQIKTNYKFSEEEKKNFCGTIAAQAASIMKKPLPAVMVMLSDEFMYMNESDQTVVFAEFRYLMNFADQEEKTAFLKEYADKMLDIFTRFTKADPHRIYMQFTEMTPEGAWKYNRQEK